MERCVPLWFFLFCCLLAALLIMLFGWLVKSSVDNNKTGLLNTAAVEIAAFPSTVKDVILELVGYASGSYQDENIHVLRDKTKDLSEFRPLPTIPGIELAGPVMKVDTEAARDGWRVLVGAFQVNGSIEDAALLLSPDLKVVKVWVLDEIPVGGEQPRPKHRNFVHGFDILPNGSIIFTFDGSISIQKFDACGKRAWTTAGKFHHSVTLDEANETVWSFGDEWTITQVSVEDGAIIKNITVDEIIAANPSIDILELRRVHENGRNENARNTKGTWIPDPHHFNDVEPLPASMAAQFPGFSAGDLLVSSRSLNLVFVLDPASLQIKWWRIGAVQRQHDPDWLESGQIAIFNNRMSRDFSEITLIDPKTFETSVRLDGRDYDFYSRIRGKQQILDDDTLVITSPQQGRAFEVSPDGGVTFEVYNLKPGSDDKNYIISELKWLPRDFFDAEAWQCETVH